MLRHPLTAMLVLTPLSFWAMYLGLKGRLKKDFKSKKFHAQLMPWLTAAIFLCAVDGHCALKAWNYSKVWGSAHAWTGVALLGGLSLQGLGSLFIDDQNSRDFHAYTGVGLGLILAAHAVTGCGLFIKI